MLCIENKSETCTMVRIDVKLHVVKNQLNGTTVYFPLVVTLL